MFTYRELLEAITNVDVQGVKRKYLFPPKSVAIADLPASFPMLLSGEELPLTFGVHGGRKRANVPYVFLISPTKSLDYEKAVEIMDNADSAFRTIFMRSQLTWETRMTTLQVAGITFLAVLLIFEGRI